MNLGEIKEKLERIKAAIEDAFEKEVIDFDQIENDISSVIDKLQGYIRPIKPEDRVIVKIGNYI